MSPRSWCHICNQYTDHCGHTKLGDTARVERIGSIRSARLSDESIADYIRLEHNNKNLGLISFSVPPPRDAFWTCRDLYEGIETWHEEDVSRMIFPRAFTWVHVYIDRVAYVRYRLINNYELSAEVCKHLVDPELIVSGAP